MDGQTVYEDMTEDAEIIVRAIQAGTIGAVNMKTAESILRKRDALPVSVATMDAERWEEYCAEDELEESEGHAVDDTPNEDKEGRYI